MIAWTVELNLSSLSCLKYREPNWLKAIWIKPQLTLPELFGLVKCVVTPFHGGSGDASRQDSGFKTTTHCFWIKYECIAFMKCKILFFSSPVISELNIKWLSEVAALKLGVHSQTHIFIMDLRVNKKSMRLHVMQACVFDNAEHKNKYSEYNNISVPLRHNSGTPRPRRPSVVSSKLFCHLQSKLVKTFLVLLK